MRFWSVLCGVSLRLILCYFLFTLVLSAGDFNAIVLQQIARMPQGGGYATTTEAHDALSRSAQLTDAGVQLRAEMAQPSYCSGATYLVFLKALGVLQKSGSVTLTRAQWQALMPKRLGDGEGVWGRWNANGPGTPRLFHELGLGRNFTSFSKARPGDFLKIFWTEAVGLKERGHSVVFLGLEEVGGVPSVRFWSSNKPGGYGEKSVPASKIAHAIFSRFEFPERLQGLASLPARDVYLANLLRKESSIAEALRMSGAK